MGTESTSTTSPPWFAIALAMTLSACIGGNARGVPLYPGAPRDPSAVAMLLGDIDTVNGQDVSGSGHTFELLPGCHVITTHTSFGKLEQGWSVSANMPRLVFAINMQANRSYVLETDCGSQTGGGSSLVLNAREQDASGQTIATLLPTHAQGDLERCRSRARSVAKSPITPGSADSNAKLVVR